VGELVSTLTAAQIAKLAYDAGARGDNIAVAAAVALAESGGRTDAVSKRNTDGTFDRGLWQINDVHTQYDRAKLVSDPAYNARAAAEVSSNWSNFTPWTTYKDKTYRKYLGQATDASSSTSSSSSTPIDLSIPGTGLSIPTPGDVFGAINSVGTGWVKDLSLAMLPVFLTVVFTVAAFALIGLGLGRLTGHAPSEVFNKVASTGQTVGNVAAVAAIA
jgi:hypothetical protein